MELLKVEHVTMQFGCLKAINELDMSIKVGEIHGLLGPNGSGKTTCFNVISGVYQPTEGNVYLEGQKINGHRKYEINKLGIARTFQHISLFTAMNVLENVIVGQHCRTRSGVVSAMARIPRERREEKKMIARAYELLDFGAWRTGRVSSPTACPTASSACWRSSAAWPASRSCSCWMKPRPA